MNESREKVDVQRAHSALRADFWNINPCIRDRLVARLRHRISAIILMVLNSRRVSSWGLFGIRAIIPNNEVHDP